MKVLIASDSYPPISIGGIQTAVISLVKSLTQNGHQVVLLTAGQKKAVVKDGKLKVYYFPNLRLPSCEHSPIAVSSGKRIQQIFTKEKPEVVHIEVAYALGANCLREAKKHNIPTVFSFHALPANNAIEFFHKIRPVAKSYSWTFWKVMGFFIKRADFVTVPSQFGLSLLTSRFKLEQAQVVSNGVDLSTFKRTKSQKYALRKLGFEGKKVILFVGRLSHEKSPDVLVKAARSVLFKCPNAFFVLVGDGPEKKQLQHLVKKYKLSESVKICGFLEEEEVKLYFEAATAFVMPSKEELQGIAVLEAMAYCLPIIVANSKALPELVDEGKNGYTFKPSSAADLAKKIAALLQDHKLPIYGNNSYQKVLAHDVKLTAQKYEEIYQALIKQSKLISKQQQESVKMPSIMLGIPGYSLG